MPETVSMKIPAASVEHYGTLFARLLTGQVPAWLPPLRNAAFSRFAELGFPTRNDEEWRFTDVRPIADIAFQQPTSTHAVTPEQIAAFVFPDSAEIVFVNGRYAPELSRLGDLPEGVIVRPLSQALQSDAVHLEAHLGRHAGFENNPFVAWNTAFLEEGAFIFLPSHAMVEKPIHLLYLGTGEQEPAAAHPRTLLIAEENSQATLIESYAGLEGAVYLTNAVTEFVLAQNAVIDHVKLQRESTRAYHIATTQIHLAKASNFTSHSITFGGAITRNDFNAILDGEHIECTLNGMYIADDRRVVDNHTSIDHAKPNCASHEVYKGILDGRSRGIFNGKIFVRQDAQKTDAKQTNKTLLLSDEAQINTKPQLEIFADDVKCTHGATIGQLDQIQLFYLRSRGIPEEAARALLIYAFAGDVVSRIKVASVRDTLDTLLLARLPQK